VCRTPTPGHPVFLPANTNAQQEALLLHEGPGLSPAKLKNIVCQTMTLEVDLADNPMAW